MSGYKIKVLVFLSSLSLSCCPLTAWAGEWVCQDSGEWVYEEGQEYLKGWQRIDGRWYCLDSATGVWISRPQLTPEGAFHLLDNKLKDLCLYQDEKEELQYKADYETSETVTVSVGYEEKPGVFHTINTYQVDKKQGIAYPVVGKDPILLW